MKRIFFFFLGVWLTQNRGTNLRQVVSLWDLTGRQLWKGMDCFTHRCLGKGLGDSLRVVHHRLTALDSARRTREITSGCEGTCVLALVTWWWSSWESSAEQSRVAGEGLPETPRGHCRTQSLGVGVPGPASAFWRYSGTALPQSAKTVHISPTSQPQCL